MNKGTQIESLKENLRDAYQKQIENKEKKKNYQIYKNEYEIYLKLLNSVKKNILEKISIHQDEKNRNELFLFEEQIVEDIIENKKKLFYFDQIKKFLPSKSTNSILNFSFLETNFKGFRSEKSEEKENINEYFLNELKRDLNLNNLEVEIKNKINNIQEPNISIGKSNFTKEDLDIKINKKELKLLVEFYAKMTKDNLDDISNIELNNLPNKNYEIGIQELINLNLHFIENEKECEMFRKKLKNEEKKENNLKIKEIYKELNENFEILVKYFGEYKAIEKQKKIQKFNNSPKNNIVKKENQNKPDPPIEKLNVSENEIKRKILIKLTDFFGNSVEKTKRLIEAEIGKLKNSNDVLINTLKKHISLISETEYDLTNNLDIINYKISDAEKNLIAIKKDFATLESDEKNMKNNIDKEKKKFEKGFRNFLLEK